MRAVAIVAMTACVPSAEYVTKVGGNVTIDRNGGYGADATAITGLHGIQIGGALWGRTLLRPMDPNHHLALGLDVFARISLFGLIIQGTDHRVEHWFDLGGEAGGGFGAARPVSIISDDHGWIGAWCDIGLWSGERYPVLALGLRQFSEGSPWNDEFVFTIGFAYVHRTLEVPDFRD